MVASSSLKNLLAALVFFLCIYDSTLAFVVHFMSRTFGQPAEKREAHSLVSPLIGFRSNGTPIPVSTDDAPGWVLRFASIRCHYCKKDEAFWSPLSKKLRDMGYKLIMVSPTAADAYPHEYEMSSGALQEAFLDMDSIRSLRLTMTPTLLIFDRRHGLIWSHNGTLDATSSAAALQVVKKTQSTDPKP